MKAYKGFNKDMTCRGFQFKEGETYREEKAELCSSGFHACENPLDCFGYYNPAGSVFHEVELDEVSEKTDGDTKRVGKVIKIGARLDVAGLCKAHFEYTKARCTPVPGNVAKDNEYCSGGYRSSLSGGDGSSLSGGDGSSLSGGNESSLSGGDESSLSGGDESSLSGRGKAEGGKNSLVVVRGNGCRVKGGLSSVLVIAEEESDNYNIIHWKAVVVDGEKIKADTWYKLKGKRLVECEEDK